MSRTYIDDEDLRMVTYKGTWVRGGTASEYMRTVASSTVVGDSFTVSFQGSSIAVYGTVDSTSGGVTTNYSIDGGATAQAVSQAGSRDTYNQQFWKSDTLQVGQHVLNVTMAKVNANPQAGEGTVWFDYFLATGPTIVSSTSSITTSSMSTSSISSMSTSSTSSMSTSSTSSMSTSSTASMSAPAAAINKKGDLSAARLGGIIGGVVFLFGLSLLLCFWRHRNRKNNAGKIAQLKPEIDPDPSTPTSGHYISPFDIISTNIEPFALGPRGVGSIDNSRSQRPAEQHKSSLHNATNLMSMSSRANFRNDSSVRFAEFQMGRSVGRQTPAGASTKSRLVPRSPQEIPASSSLPPVSSLSPGQHVDSGMRSINVEMLTSPPELPPFYTAL